jgi:hypothetical protein
MDWKIGYQATEPDTSVDVDINVDFGLGDAAFPEAEQKVVEKLDKAFNPIIEELYSIKEKNMRNLNTKSLNGKTTAIQNGFMKFIGFSEDRINDILNYNRCNQKQQTKPNSKICTQTLDYSPLEEDLFAMIQNKISDVRKKIENKWKNKISDRLQSGIDKIKELEEKIKETTTVEFNVNLSDALQSMLSSECDKEANQRKQKNPMLGDMIEAFCDVGINNDVRKFYDVWSGLKGFEEVGISADFFFKGGLRPKKIDACEIIEALNSNNYDIRMEAKTQISNLGKNLLKKIQEEVIKIALEEILTRIPQMLIKQKFLDVPMCEMVAQIKVTMAQKKAEAAADPTKAADGLEGFLGDLSTVGASVFGDGAVNLKDLRKKCYDSLKDNKSEAGQELVYRINAAATDNMVPEPITSFVSQAVIAIEALWTPDVGVEGQTTLGLLKQQEAYVNCLKEKSPKAFKKVFQDCLDGKENLQLFSMYNPILPQLQLLSLNLQWKKKQTCEEDRRGFFQTIPHRDGDINVNLDFLIKKEPNKIKDDPEAVIPQGNLYVLKQKLMKLKVQFESFKDEKNDMYDFYMNEYKNIMGQTDQKNEGNPNIHPDALCYISYDHEDGKTQMGSGRDSLAGLLGFNKEKETSECYVIPDNCEVSTIENTTPGYFKGIESGATEPTINKIEWTNNGYSLGGYVMTCNEVETAEDGTETKTKTPLYRKTIYKDGIGIYCHKLAKDINQKLITIKKDYIDEKICLNSPSQNISCETHEDCKSYGGECASKLYGTKLAENNMELNGIRNALNQFTHCIAITNKLKGAKIEVEEPKVETNENDIKEYISENLFKVKIGLLSQSELVEKAMETAEYKELFDEKIKLDKNNRYIKEICMNLKEPEDYLNMNHEYRECKKLKIEYQQKINHELITNEYKNLDGIDSGDIERYEKILRLKEENQRLEQLLEN